MINTIEVSGMSCGHCKAAVEKALSQIPEIREVEVDLNAGRATFEAEDSLDLAKVKSAIEEAGYEATL